MKSFILVVFICGMASVCQAQKTVNLADVSKHVGDTVRVCGKIYSSRFLQTGKQPTLLNMGAKYPDQLLTVVIYGDNRSKFGYKPEDILLEKQICITGKIELYNGKPQLVISEPFQIKMM